MIPVFAPLAGVLIILWLVYKAITMPIIAIVRGLRNRQRGHTTT